MVLHELDPERLTGSHWGLSIQPPAPPEPGRKSDWSSHLRATHHAAPSVRNYQVAIPYQRADGKEYRTPPLRVSVESFEEDGQLRFQAVLLADRTVFGYGDSREDALQDMANFLADDLSSLEEEDGSVLTAMALARRDCLRRLFGIPTE